MSRDQSERRGFTILAKVIDPDHQEKERLLLHNRDGEGREYVWEFLMQLGISWYSLASLDGHMQRFQPEKGVITKR